MPPRQARRSTAVTWLPRARSCEKGVPLGLQGVPQHRDLSGLRWPLGRKHRQVDEPGQVRPVQRHGEVPSVQR